MGQKQKTEKKEERLNDGDNNGQATHGARKHAWLTQAAWAKKEKKKERRRANDGNNNAPSYAWHTQAAWANNIVQYNTNK